MRRNHLFACLFAELRKRSNFFCKFVGCPDRGGIDGSRGAGDSEEGVEVGIGTGAAEGKGGKVGNVKGGNVGTVAGGVVAGVVDVGEGGGGVVSG